MTSRAPAADLGGRVMAVAALTGVGAGLGGILLTLLLHAIQHLAFGYTENSFLYGVQQASSLRRVLAMTIGGALVGTGWWALHRWAAPAVPVRRAIAEHAPRMPVLSTLIDAVLQISAVGFGASLGREGAPRQVGAVWGSWLAARVGLSVGQRRTIIACGAGAGLAAVYNVPLGGALFTLEILLASAAMRHVVPAVLSSAVATAIAWTVLGNQPTYVVRFDRSSASALVFAIVLGPIAGLVAAAFQRLTGWGQRHAATGAKLPVATTVLFALIGVLSCWFPQLLGNGKGIVQLALDGAIGLGLLAALALLKPIATASCLLSGARGGLLTPSLATGAALGAGAGTLWSQLWSGTPVGVFAIIGAAAVLAATQRAPVCAIVLVLEFTRTGEAFLVPIMLAVAGAFSIERIIDRSQRRTVD